MNIGDTVRYLNATGGGVVKRIEGKIAYVEEDGFENPVLTSELVVVLPAGHQATSGARLMFDQSAYDRGKAPAPKEKKIPSGADSAEDKASGQPPLNTSPETTYGNRLNLTLAFEPADSRRLSDTTFAAVLVNDSNYTLLFCLSGAPKEGAPDDWKVIYQGSVAPNELIDLAEYSHSDLPGIERIALQAIAFKGGKGFELKVPVDARRRLDITKFHKLHCFRNGIYFDTPVLEFPLIKDDAPANTPAEADMQALRRNLDSAESRRALMQKNEPRREKKVSDPASNPHKLLPPIEVDLHMDALTDTIAGMQPADMLNMQLDTVRKVMRDHRRRIGQKIIFIHGKGEGVLREAVLKLLRKEYPKADLQDASFREYGFGATLVTVH